MESHPFRILQHCSELNMSNDTANFAAQWPETMSAFRADAPEITRAFGTMFQSLMKDGAISAMHKELIAVAIGVATHCKPCIFAHVEKALKSGATPEQVRDAVGVAVMMGGGPAYTHAAIAIEAIRHFSAAATK